MAKTWRLDEYIPCPDLYLRRGTLSEGDREVQDVAKLIGRTPASVAFRKPLSAMFVQGEGFGVGRCGPPITI